MEPALHISAIGVFFGSVPPHADGEMPWIEVTIRDASALPSRWRLDSAARGNAQVDFNTIIDSANFSWNLEDGDVIRTHIGAGSFFNGWPYDQDTVKSDNNPDRWDYQSTEDDFGFDSRSGFLYIADGSNVIQDVVVYANEGQPISISTTVMEILTVAVSAGLWPSANEANAFDIGATSNNFARLMDTSRHANDASAWETVSYDTVPQYPVVINEINSEGGFGTNVSNSDFVELYNNSDAITTIVEADRWYLGKGNANHDPMNFTNLPMDTTIAANGFYLVTFGGDAPDTVGGITRDSAISIELGDDETVAIYYQQEDGWFSEAISESYSGAANSWGLFPDGSNIDRDGNQTPTPGATNVKAIPPPRASNEIHQESFEDTSGWTLSHTFNDNGSDFAGRFMSGDTPGDISGDMESKVQGSYYIAMEDANGFGDADIALGAPANAVVTLTLDPVTSITGKSNLKLRMLLAAFDNNGGPRFDFHSGVAADDVETSTGGDRVEIFATIDGGTRNRIGFFTALDNGSANEALHQYTGGDNNNIGTRGDEVPETGQDYEFAIAGTGDSLVITIEVRVDAGNEAVLIDNLRVLGD